MSAVLAPNQSPDRSTYLGSSDAAAILGVSKWKTSLDVYLAKTEPEPDNFADPDRARVLRRGHRLEPYIVEMMVDALREAGHTVEVVGTGRRFQHPDHPFIAAEIDCELIVDGELVNGEAKSASFRVIDEWGEAGTDEIPIHYAAQVHLAQAATRRRTTWVAALFGFDDVVMYRIDADDELQDALIGRMVAFWNDHVLARVPPAPERMTDIARLYRNSGPPPVEASAKVAEVAARLRSIREERKALEEVADQAEFEIAAFMGESDTLLVGGKPYLSFRHQVRMLVDGKRLATEQPEVHKQFLRPSVSRPILFKKVKP